MDKYAPIVFLLVGGAILVSYALERHWAYQKKYLDYPLNRKAIFPFIL